MAPKVNAPLPPMEIKAVEPERSAIERARHAVTTAVPVPQSSSTPGHAPSIAMGAVVKDVLIRQCGTLKAAAIELGMDLGQLSRDLDSGDFKFKRLDGHEVLKVAIARAMYGVYGDDDPKARKRRVIRRLREGLEELAEIEGAA